MIAYGPHLEKLARHGRFPPNVTHQDRQLAAHRPPRNQQRRRELLKQRYSQLGEWVGREVLRRPAAKPTQRLTGDVFFRPRFYDNMASLEEYRVFADKAPTRHVVGMCRDGIATSQIIESATLADVAHSPRCRQPSNDRLV